MEDVQERQMVTIQVREAVLCIVGFLKGEGNPPEKISSGRFGSKVWDLIITQNVDLRAGGCGFHPQEQDFISENRG
jgi:hypothetical protein